MTSNIAELIRHAVAEHQAHRWSEAERLYRQAIQLDPLCADAYHLLGVLAIQANHMTTAIQWIQQAIAIKPNQAEYYANLGVARERSREFEAALHAYESALSLKPDFPQAIYNQAIARLRLGQNELARQGFERCLELDPNLFDAYLNLGALLMESGDLVEAKSRYLQAIQLQPSNPDAHLNLGNVYFLLRDYPNARQAFERAIASDPNNPFAYKHLGLVARAQGFNDEAVAAVQRSLKLAPRDPESLALMVDLLLNEHAWTPLAAFQHQLQNVIEERVRSGVSVVVSPLTLLHLPDPISPQWQLACARGWAESMQQRDVVRQRLAPYQPPRRLRIGYLSADFCEHPVGFILSELIESHDRESFEIYGYSIGANDGSPTRQRLMKAFDRFRDLEACSYRESADSIAADQIDILVDLQGYTEHSRTRIMAMRPAPIQVSYLGYPGTMGANFIDFLIADPYVIPEGADINFSEKIIRLPGCYLSNDSQRYAFSQKLTRSEVGLPDKGFVFCGFSSPKKLTEPMFSLWLRLLQKVPESTLWLRTSSPTADARLLAAAIQSNVAPDRLIFAPHVSMETHLARQRLADLFLDTFPYNQHSTAQDALSLGVPVLTLSGEAFASRVAGSLLTTLELPELIADSLEEYERKALWLGQNRDAMENIRSRLASVENQRRLIDGQAKTRNLENAFRQIYRQHLAKRSFQDHPPGLGPSTSTIQATHSQVQPIAHDKERSVNDDREWQRARQLHLQERFDEAEQLYRKLLTQLPSAAEVHHFLGILLSQTGRGAEGAESIQRAIQASPQHPMYYFNRGVVLYNLGREQAAIESWQHATRLNPNYSAAWEELSKVYQRTSQWQLAKHTLLQRLRICPGQLDTLCDLADAYDSLREWSLAKRCYQQILTEDPRYTRALNNLANLYKSEFELNKAASLYQQAIESDPHTPLAYYNLANVYTLMDRGEDAIQSFEQALRLEPNHIDAWIGLGSTWMRVYRYREALPCFERAYELAPLRADVIVRLIQLYQQTCRWDLLPDLTEKLCKRIQEPSWLNSHEIVPPLVMLALDPPVAGNLQRRVAEQHQATVATKTSAAVESLYAPQTKHRHRVGTAPHRLRVGYLTADFRSHPVGMLVVELFEKHDRRLLETYAYSFGPNDGSTIRQRVEKAADHFVDMESWSFQRSIDRIRSDAVDILIDLQGFTGDSRPEILAARPAPIQILYLGYAGTSGAPWIDCVIADKYVVPHESQVDFSERVIYLPGCYMVADSKRSQGLKLAVTVDERGEARVQAGLPREACVLCGFSAPHKITSRIFDVWMRILRQVPQAILWLRLEAPEAIANLRAMAISQAISPERLVFAPKVSMDEHLARHRLADLFLDTFPYNQHSTAGDALRMGLPLVTISGSTMASRVAGSYLFELGLEELITRDLASYEAKIVELANEPGKLEWIRQRLGESLQRTDLFDGTASAAKLEHLYQQIWLEQTDVSDK